jgi:hypothetical protein
MIVVQNQWKSWFSGEMVGYKASLIGKVGGSENGGYPSNDFLVHETYILDLRHASREEFCKASGSSSFVTARNTEPWRRHGDMSISRCFSKIPLIFNKFHHHDLKTMHYPHHFTQLSWTCSAPHMHTHAHTHTHQFNYLYYICIYIHTCTHICAHAHTHTYLYLYLYVYVYR